jgi:hypothetical protein
MKENNFFSITTANIEVQVVHYDKFWPLKPLLACRKNNILEPNTS